MPKEPCITRKRALYYPKRDLASPSELTAARCQLAEREGLEREKRRLLDDLQVSKSEAAELRSANRALHIS